MVGIFTKENEATVLHLIIPENSYRRTAKTRDIMSKTSVCQSSEKIVDSFIGPTPFYGNLINSLR